MKENKNNINSVKEKYEGINKPIKLDEGKLTANEETLKRAKKYEYLKDNIRDVSKYGNIGQGWKKVLEMFGSNYLEMAKNLNISGEIKKKKYIFYLISTTVPENTIVNVLNQSKKLKGIEVIPVLRGVNRKGKRPVEKFIWNYVNEINEKIGGGIRVKINPIIFEKVDAKFVPAFVLADCPAYEGIIRSKECDYKAVLYGDTSLDFAVEKFKEEGYLDE